VAVNAPASPKLAGKSRWRLIGAESMLLLAAILWGGAFVAQKRAWALEVEVLPLISMRFLLGAAVLAPLAIWRAPRAGAKSGRRRRDLWIGGAVAGAALFVGAILQQAGMKWTTPGVAGFITGLYVLFVPMLGLLVGVRAHAPVWIGACLATVGLYLMSVHGRPEINPGDALVLLGSVAWALHVLVIAWAAPRTDPILLSVIQFAVTGVLASIASIATGRSPIEGLENAPFDILYLGVVAVAIAFTLQVIGQRVTPAPHAVIILSLEAIFAAIGGAIFFDERFGIAALIGSGLMLGGALLSQLVDPPKPVKAPEAEAATDSPVERKATAAAPAPRSIDD